MKKLFEALKEQYPDSKILDVRFSVDSGFIGPIEPVAILDEKLAIAVREAVEVDIATLF